MKIWRFVIYASLACLTAWPAQAAQDAPPSWALHNTGGLISVDLDLIQSYRMQAIAGQDIGMPPAHAATARKIVSVAILDTGIDASHAAFAGLLVAQDTAGAGADPDTVDTDGHGTHLAG